ncbi:MAG: dephospho-CoA kinase [Gemmatimonadales bacterium]|nr:dephospho-CoA kinase [Gemmatimonadales bacterium]
MLRVGLTGNAAAGKSTVLALFKQWGAGVIDSDLLAREAVAPGSPALDAIFKRFGGDLRLPDGSLDRASLRRRVMANDEQRAVLNAIVHPEVARLSQKLEQDARARGDRIIVADIPLLFEVLSPSSFDVVVLVDAPEAVRRSRLLEMRGYSREEADDLLGAQLPSRLKRERSHIVIDNDGTREALEARAREAWMELERRAPAAGG